MWPDGILDDACHHACCVCVQAESKYVLENEFRRKHYLPDLFDQERQSNDTHIKMFTRICCGCGEVLDGIKHFRDELAMKYAKVLETIKSNPELRTRIRTVRHTKNGLQVVSPGDEEKE